MLQTVFAEGKGQLNAEAEREIFKERIVFIIVICGLDDGAVLVCVMRHDLIDALMQEAVDMVIVGRGLVDRKMINCIRCFQDAVCKAVRQIERGQSPDLCGLTQDLRRVIRRKAEHVDPVNGVAQTDDIGAELIGDICLISAGGEHNAGRTVEGSLLSCIHDTGILLLL